MRMPPCGVLAPMGVCMPMGVAIPCHKVNTRPELDAPAIGVRPPMGVCAIGVPLRLKHPKLQGLYDSSQPIK